MNRKKKIALAAVFLTTIIVLLSFNQVKSQENRGQVNSLLTKYGFRIEHEGKGKYYRLPNKSTYKFNIYNTASKLSGFNLEKYEGERVREVSYKVYEKSQPMDKRDIEAVILYKKDTIVGAYLRVYGQVCGVTSLDENLSPKPENIDPSKLELKDVSDVEVSDVNDRQGNSKITIMSGSLKEKILKILESSTPHNLGLKTSGNLNGKEITICYKDGSYVKITYYKDINKFIINNIDNWYYELNSDISKLICN
ncbi:hypothetical protein BJV85_001389 [Clostridium acetobutylicum]|uniref:Hypothetical secreted protein n=1 Tax=Clostridium acetobutylicum (strain ATCC 824 / DSM 792 / JCM 1419 / IAM 19013 / LMG 5710 / NBRC 13948 / NRRL B-527 / VKM B-1787 / 2291 / W) TaxID=272562 RepID=Q97G72_CLOAB|nr:MULTISPECIES: DUF4830 domain-containing protein [Clostridium]AAK80451.1 Hypothetical secreted protein [Clostridium acetobutylicum ATCC 824]ADZ21548.1 Hypothetical secreted protein [Clostridium acetobutylicum EA 2018]AEI32389.1 hypothetical protein SMB_G2532 [Clostridium acetobutylicum DSM 1731]AWV79132.1 DUF4830 domain-containing protein [Clostridium acetobutylicum]MBC2394905.1 DUF4830 domain-containing protein [Clostridium acetobutylicum]